MFSSLSVRDFRIYWVGMFVSLIGTWIQTIAQSWLVFELSQSAFLMGLVGFLGSMPIFLLTLFAGAMADRVNKRKILIITQAAFMLLAFVLAALTQLHLISTWHIMIIAIANGVVMAFDAPSRQAMVVELVGKRYLMNAIALNSAAFNSARMIGPAVAGILVAAIGMSGCFYINAVSFIPVLASLWFIRNRHHQMRPAAGASLVHDIKEGIRYIGRTRVVLMMILIVGTMSMFGISYMILMPIVADRILHIGMAGLGMLMSCAGGGALAAALMLARLSGLRRKGPRLIAACAVFSLFLTLFSFSTLPWLSGVLIVFVGWSSVTAVSLINTLLQSLVPDEYRGRIMSAYMFTFAGVLPFGNLFSGALAQAVGVAHAVALSGVVCGILFGVIFVLGKEIVQL